MGERRFLLDTDVTQAELDGVLDVLMELPEDRRTLLQSARGMWQDRDDLPSVAELRIEMNRDFEYPSR
jgi:hypothetical protein